MAKDRGLFPLQPGADSISDDAGASEQVIQEREQLLKKDGNAPPPWDRIFYPQSVAVVGASADPSSQGNRYVRLLQEFGFKGPVYPVNPNPNEIEGLKTYRDLLEAPGPVDYVISCIPAHLVLQLTHHCVAKGVKVLHLYTARFAETGLDEGEELERKVAATALAGGVRVIGPNCMGVYSPAGGISFRFSFPKDSGNVGYISQSGGNTQALVSRTAWRGVRFSKIISYGNAADLNEADFMEYFAGDPDTRTVAGYIEGVRNGRRFFRAVARATETKRVVLLKGGMTNAGTRAVASHTSSLAGDEAVWNAFLKQSGVIGADTMDEMGDLVVACEFLKPVKGLRTAVLGGGGGESVAAADACEKAGLIVPPMPGYIRDGVKEAAPYTWTMLSNPLDGSVTGGPQLFRSVADKLARDPGIDLLIGNGNSDWSLDEEDGKKNFLDSVRYLLKLGQEVDKPLAIVMANNSPTGWRAEAVREALELCVEAKVPVFPSMERAARAIVKVAGAGSI